MLVKNSKGREFVVERSTDSRQIYVGTPAIISDIAAQLIVHDAMRKSFMKSSKSWTNLEHENALILGVGFKVPFFMPMNMAEKLAERSIKMSV